MKKFTALLLLTIGLMLASLPVHAQAPVFDEQYNAVGTYCDHLKFQFNYDYSFHFSDDADYDYTIAVTSYDSNGGVMDYQSWDTTGSREAGQYLDSGSFEVVLRDNGGIRIDRASATYDVSYAYYYQHPTYGDVLGWEITGTCDMASNSFNDVTFTVLYQTYP